MKKLLRKLKSILRSIIMMFKEEKIKPVPILTERDALLEGKVALITGGTSGIGYAIAEEFLKAGAKVIVAGTNDKKTSKCVRKLTNFNDLGGYKALLLM